MGIVSFVKSAKEERREKIRKFLTRRHYKRSVAVRFSTKVETEIYYWRHKSNCIVIDGWLVSFYKNTTNIMNRMSMEVVGGNWGDDINVWFLERVSRKKVIPAKLLFFSKYRKKYCAIGSIIPTCVNSRTTIWGSGWYGVKEIELKRPMKVLAVRGPLTREYLLQQGVDCPVVYGDPALLLPKYYLPKITYRYKVGFVLHHRDWDIIGDETIGKMKENAAFIDMTNYKCWTDIIDLICSCDLILSSSLHGLIVSDAYGVPNVFCEFAYHHPNYVKYQDYFLSVNRAWVEPIQYDDHLDMNLLEVQAREQSERISVDTTSLENSCPFF